MKLFDGYTKEENDNWVSKKKKVLVQRKSLYEEIQKELHTLSINNFQINNPTGYGMYTFMYKSGDYYCTSSIIVGPTTGAISATGTTDSNGGCVHATFTLDPDDMTVNTIEITPPSGFEFVGYFK